MNLGELIAQKRKALNLSQEQLAEKICVSRSAVAKWESNKGIPDIQNMKALSKILGVSIDTFIESATSEVTVENIANNKTITNGTEECLEEKLEKKIQVFISKKCNVELTDWNDGISEAYLIRQDKDLIYYLLPTKRASIIGALSKRYVAEIQLCDAKDKRSIDFAQYNNIDRNYFIEKRVNINLNEKHIWDGVFGKDTEFRDATISSFAQDKLIVEIQNQFSDTIIPMEEVVKIELSEE